MVARDRVSAALLQIAAGGLLLIFGLWWSYLGLG